MKSSASLMSSKNDRVSTMIVHVIRWHTSGVYACLFCMQKGWLRTWRIFDICATATSSQLPLSPCCRWCCCLRHLKTRCSNMEYTVNSMHTSTVIDFFYNWSHCFLTSPQCVCAFFQCLNREFFLFIVSCCPSFFAIRWTRYSNMEYTDIVMYTNTEIAIVSLSYPIDI